MGDNKKRLSENQQIILKHELTNLKNQSIYIQIKNMCKTKARIDYIKQNILPSITIDIETDDDLDDTFIKMCIYAADLLKKTHILKYVKYSLNIGTEKNCNNYKNDIMNKDVFRNQIMFIIASAIEHSEGDQQEDLRAIKYHCEEKIPLFEYVTGNIINNLKKARNLMYKHLCDRQKFKYETNLSNKNNQIQIKTKSLETDIPTNIAEDILKDGNGKILKDAELIALTIRTFENYTNHYEIQSEVLYTASITQEMRDTVFNNILIDAKNALKKAKTAKTALKKAKTKEKVSEATKKVSEATKNVIDYATDAMEVVIEEVSLANGAAADEAKQAKKSVKKHTLIIAKIFKEATDIFTNVMENHDIIKKEANVAVANIFTKAAEKITHALDKGVNFFDAKTRLFLVETALNTYYISTTTELINNSKTQIKKLLQTVIKKAIAQKKAANKALDGKNKSRKYKRQAKKAIKDAEQNIDFIKTTIQEIMKKQNKTEQKYAQKLLNGFKTPNTEVAARNLVRLKTIQTLLNRDDFSDITKPVSQPKNNARKMLSNVSDKYKKQPNKTIRGQGDKIEWSNIRLRF